jgi:predicted nuclease of restriction endonuclease-like (RecB) superfamily
MSQDRIPAHASYANLLSEIKDRIQQAQTRAILSVNAELVRLYWDIGRIINQRQRVEGWGAGVIPRLADELRNELPAVKGFSERNIKRMLAFYRVYPKPNGLLPEVAKLAAPKKVPQSAAQIQPSPKVPQPAALLPDSLLWTIPWFHHIVLMEKVKDLPARVWYMQQTLANGWSRNVLVHMIESEAHRRQGKALSNFERLLPAPQSDLVQQTLKDPYIFDFLTLDESFHEHELEVGLIQHLEKFLLELGQGFTFVGRQYCVEVGAKDFHIDLLFYHLKLRAFIVIDLKTGSFQPEYAGKLNFYCNVINDKLRHPDDQPTIGLILCQGKDRVLAEYALSGIDKPIGVSSYELTRALPPRLQSALPTVEELEAELGESEEATTAPRTMHTHGLKKRRAAKARKPTKKLLRKKRRKK